MVNFFSCCSQSVVYTGDLTNDTSISFASPSAKLFVSTSDFLDGIKNAKDIAYSLQKLFNEYQKVYTENYQQIRNILLESKNLGKNINLNQVSASVKDLEELYNDSKTSDVLSLRLTTLFERLKALVATEQNGMAQK